MRAQCKWIRAYQAPDTYSAAMDLVPEDVWEVGDTDQQGQ